MCEASICCLLVTIRVGMKDNRRSCRRIRDHCAISSLSSVSPCLLASIELKDQRGHAITHVSKPHVESSSHNMVTSRQVAGVFAAIIRYVGTHLCLAAQEILSRMVLLQWCSWWLTYSIRYVEIIEASWGQRAYISSEAKEKKESRSWKENRSRDTRHIDSR